MSKYNVHIVLMGRLILVVLLLAAGAVASCSSKETVAAKPIPPTAKSASALPFLVGQKKKAPRKRIARLNENSLAVLDKGLGSKDWMVRLIATNALTCLPSSVALVRLEARLADVEPDVRAAAIQGLSSFRNQRAGALILSVQDDSTEELQLRVLAASATSRTFNNCK